MSKKNRQGVVYSTNPDFDYQHRQLAQAETLPANQQKLRVELDKRSRKGKAVTLISGFVGKEEDLASLGKVLKSLCGVGGTAKDEEIILQGDHRGKVIDYLKNQGYTGTKQVGG